MDNKLESYITKLLLFCYLIKHLSNYIFDNKCINLYIYLEGNKVNIILDGYPHMEFGYLKGEVLSISPMFDDNGYTATINIKSETTTYGKKYHWTKL